MAIILRKVKYEEFVEKYKIGSVFGGMAGGQASDKKISWDESELGIAAENFLVAPKPQSNEAIVFLLLSENVLFIAQDDIIKGADT
ncbi:hypothetical protein AGMMS49949_03330 [Alphaproteobacteria bacterium]|nr:hypothetical protein AGMMS49949_03330 [Alphaproteobacteria bacterium]GHS96818.1 hypothetical protein AGMMS50296_3290 [Alphaproteobacteria bacterium]